MVCLAFVVLAAGQIFQPIEPPVVALFAGVDRTRSRELAKLRPEGVDAFLKKWKLVRVISKRQSKGVATVFLEDQLLSNAGGYEQLKHLKAHLSDPGRSDTLSGSSNKAMRKELLEASPYAGLLEFNRIVAHPDFEIKLEPNIEAVLTGGDGDPKRYRFRPVDHQWPKRVVLPTSSGDAKQPRSQATTADQDYSFRMSVEYQFRPDKKQASELATTAVQELVAMQKQFTGEFSAVLTDLFRDLTRGERFGKWDGKSQVNAKDLDPALAAQMIESFRSGYQAYGFSTPESAELFARTAQISPQGWSVSFAFRFQREGRAGSVIAWSYAAPFPGAPKPP